MASKYEELAESLASEAVSFLHHDAGKETRAKEIAILVRLFVPLIRNGAHKDR